MKVITRMLILLSVLGLAGCGDGERGYNTATNPAVQERAEALLEAMKAEDFERVADQYYEKFFAKFSREQWLTSMKTLLAERGPMRAFHLRRSQADTRFSGKFFMLEYETVHTGNKRLHHIVTLLLPVTGGDIRLAGHKMTPWETDVVETNVEKPGVE